MLLVCIYNFRKPGIDVKIHIHGKHQFFDFSGRMGHTIKAGESIHSQVSINEVHQLPTYYTSVDNVHHQSENEAKHYETVCSEIKFDECIQQELTRQMIHQTDENCLVPWFPTKYSIEQIGSHQVCTKENDVNASYWIYYNKITNQQNDCNRPCKSIIVSVGGKNYNYNKNNNYGTAMFYFSMTSTKTMENYLYTFTNLFAEVGGYLGLLLGYSCLDLASSMWYLAKKKPWRGISWFE